MTGFPVLRSVTLSFSSHIHDLEKFFGLNSTNIHTTFPRIDAVAQACKPRMASFEVRSVSTEMILKDFLCWGRRREDMNYKESTACFGLFYSLANVIRHRATLSSSEYSWMGLDLEVLECGYFDEERYNKQLNGEIERKDGYCVTDEKGRLYCPYIHLMWLQRAICVATLLRVVGRGMPILLSTQLPYDND
jgi:hypothetical protein